MKYFILIIFSFFTINTFSQHGQMSQEMQAQRIGVIKGTLMDSVNQVPLEFASVVLYSMRDSSIVEGLITGGDGVFEMKNLPFGRYYLITDFLGYNKRQISPIMVSPKSQTINLGMISLLPSQTHIGEVEVVADRQYMQYKVDRKVINVSQDITARGGTAIDVLENTPSIQVDIDGNVQLRGSSSFKVLIDGKPSIFDGSDALKQISSSSIENIEIITNPSVKYDPDGTAGIINIIMKKNKTEGVNGIVNLTGSNTGESRYDFLLSKRTQKVNYFIGGNYGNHVGNGSMNNDLFRFFPDSTIKEIKGGSRNHQFQNQSIKAGAEYYFSDKTSLTLSGEFGSFKRNFSGIIDGSFYTNDFLNYQNQSDSRSGGSSDFISGTVTLDHKFNEEGHQLTFTSFYTYDKGSETENSKVSLTDSYFVPDSIMEWLKIEEPEKENEFEAKIDYTLPLKNGMKIEAGSQMKFETQNSTYNRKDYFNNNWIENSNYSKSTSFDRQIHSGYVTFGGEIAKIQYLFGIREEYTYRNLTSSKMNEDLNLNRFDFFPSLHTTYSLNEMIQFQASYSKRIERPRSHNIEPDTNYIDNNTRRIGNPGLLPEYTNSFEAGTQIRIPKGFFSIEGYYRITNGLMSRYQTYDTIQNMTFMQYKNVGQDKSLGIEMMINYDVAKWLTINASVNSYYYVINVSDDLSLDADRANTNFGGRFNGTIKFDKSTRMQISAFYMGPSITAQGDREGMTMINAAVKRDFFNRKFSASIQVRDIFQTGKYEFTNYSPSMTQHILMKRKSPVISLTLSYVINNYKQDRMKPENGGGDMNMDMGF